MNVWTSFGIAVCATVILVVAILEGPLWDGSTSPRSASCWRCCCSSEADPMPTRRVSLTKAFAQRIAQDPTLSAIAWPKCLTCLCDVDSTEIVHMNRREAHILVKHHGAEEVTIICTDWDLGDPNSDENLPLTTIGIQAFDPRVDDGTIHTIQVGSATVSE